MRLLLFLLLLLLLLVLMLMLFLLLQKLGKELEDLEAAQKDLNNRLMKLSQTGTDLDGIQKSSLKLADLQEQYELKEERYYELAEIAGDL